MNWGINGFANLRRKFSRISMVKLKTGIFDGPQIRELMKDSTFDKALSKAELSACQALKFVVINFQWNYRMAKDEKEIEKLLKSFCQVGSWMSIKSHFQWSHLDYFPKNCGDLSEEQVDHFHQDIMKERYKDINLFDNYCWCLKLDVGTTEHRRKSLKRSFIKE